MAAVHLHNALFTPATPTTTLGSSGGSHMRRASSGSATSGITSSDMRSSRRLLGGNQPYIPTLETGTQPNHSTHHERKWTQERRLRKSLRLWSYARLALSFALLFWVAYCTSRYFVALRIYGGDHIRSQYALGMGIASTFTILFFGSECLLMLRFFDRRCPHWLAITLHSLTYLSSIFVMSISIVNLVLVFHWRRPRGPAEFGRSLTGRCTWDVDVVWGGGTGMACTQGDAMPFGDWLGAAIFRLVISAVILVAYHLAVHGHRVAMYSQGISTVFNENTNVHPITPDPSTPDEPQHLHEPLMQETIAGAAGIVKALPVSEDDHQRRSLSFTAAGQALSRIEGSENNVEAEDEDVDSESSLSFSSEALHVGEEFQQRRSLNDSPDLLSDSPLERFSPSTPSPQHTSADWYAENDTLPPNPPPSSFHRPIATPSNDLQDFASAFRSLVSRITQETQDGMDLTGTTGSSVRETREVRVLGSYISRMSTIDSIASREVASVRSPSRTDTSQSQTSSGSPQQESPTRNLSRNPTANSRTRDRGGTPGSQTSVSSEG